MVINLELGRNYEITPIDELASQKRYYYPGANTQQGNDGIIVEITPTDARKWISIFAFGDLSPRGVSGIYSTPNPDIFCVVSRGAGYMVSSQDPRDWQEVVTKPIIDVISIPAHQILIFADYTELIAYDKTGIRWRSGHLSHGGFKITGIADNSLKGEFWNDRNDKMDEFNLDMITGSVRQ